MTTLVQHCDKGQRTNAKTAASVALFLFETFCRYVNDLRKYHMEDCMYHVLGLGAMKLAFRTKAENLFITLKRSMHFLFIKLKRSSFI